MAFIKFVRASDKEEVLVNTSLIRTVERDTSGKAADKQSRIVLGESTDVVVVGNLSQIAGWLSSS